MRHLLSRRLIFLLSTLLLPEWSNCQVKTYMMDDREVIVQMFEWRYADVARECTEYLGPKGFGAVQVSSPTENLVVMASESSPEVVRPWWERYQPVSYILKTRSGDENDFREMVEACFNARVRVYVDVILNQMTMASWGPGVGTAGSTCDGKEQDYPAVPYTSRDFHRNGSDCMTKSGNIEDFNDAKQLRNCRLYGLNDLNQSNYEVLWKMAAFMRKLLRYGVAGFHYSGAKFMLPGDIGTLMDAVGYVNKDFDFPRYSAPFAYFEIADYGGQTVGSDSYYTTGRISEFKYIKYISEAFRKINQMSWLWSFGEAWGMLDQELPVVFLDDHIQQRGLNRELGNMTISFRDGKLYKLALIFMLSWPYGLPRLMSSYQWEQKWVDGKDVNNWMGPPHDDNYNILPVEIQPDGMCGNGWVCEHRWDFIASLLSFRNTTKGEPVKEWWDNRNHQVSFCRGNKGFVAINNEDSVLSHVSQTCLPAGTYCDMISGGLQSGKCKGRSVEVTSSGRAAVLVSHDWDIPAIVLDAVNVVPSSSISEGV